MNERLTRISNELVGKTIDEARDIFPNVRAVIIDDVYPMITQDVKIDRINVEIENNKIIKIIGVY